MKIFPDCRIDQWQSGRRVLTLTAEGNWEQFSDVARRLVKVLQAFILDRDDSFDIRIWKIRYSGEIFSIVYDDFPNGISIEPKSPNADAFLPQIKNILCELDNDTWLEL